MIRNFKEEERKKDLIVLLILIAVFMIVVWLCTPSGTKFVRLAFWGSNIRLSWAKLTDNADATEWIFHRNNAVYLSKMKNKDGSFAEIDKAIMTFPSYQSENNLEQLYKDRAIIRLYWKDYDGALEDYLRLHTLDFMDNLRVALLLRESRKYKEALSYCNNILYLDPTAYAGYACIASLYDDVGKYDVAAKVFDILILKVPNKAKYYADRAMYKRKAGDEDGYNKDIAKAKELSPAINFNYSLIDEIMNPKILQLSSMPVN